jgi:hypothetical protein
LQPEVITTSAVRVYAKAQPARALGSIALWVGDPARNCAKYTYLTLAPPQTDQNQLPPFSHRKILVSEPDSISPDISLRNDGAFNLS